MKTVHIIFNAHIDPIWLWPWQSGLDEILATCRSACDRLDAHPDIVFTRGEAWVYSEIEKIDTELFGRIRSHIDAGRWEIAGGWWIQPDCNLPSGFAMERQIELGKQYFLSRFGRFPTVAYNVDSFGHAATLPGIMRGFGQNSYVMMRPQPAEMELPACLFRWQGYEGGPEVTTFRIVGSYNKGHDLDEKSVRAALEPLPNGIDHTMIFVGFGDHGGGPTERQIQWVRDRRTSFDGVELKFSSPARFFESIGSQRDRLPVVTGELQQHAIGCYSVCRPIKTAVRRAEHALRQAELLCGDFETAYPAYFGAQIEAGWQRVCLAHFHDTLGGSCLPSAYLQPLSQLGHAYAVADELLQEGLRRKLNALPPDPLQRIVLYNASDSPYCGPVEFTPWLDWMQWQSGWKLLDEAGRIAPHQTMASEALTGDFPRLLFDVEAAPQQMRTFRIDTNAEPASHAAEPAGALPNAKPIISPSRIEFPNGFHLETPDLALYADDSDTWSHGLDRYGEEAVDIARWSAETKVDDGPLMTSIIRSGVVGNSNLTAEWRAYSRGYAELRLSVEWVERHKLLKLVTTLPSVVVRRTDGILGGRLTRPLDGRELPLRDGVVLQTESAAIGIVAPDVFAADATPKRIRFTLLRSALMAHHDPHPGDGPRRSYSDRGEHTFIFQFFAGAHANPDLIDRQATQLQRPLIVADLTRGMPKRLFDR